MKGTIVRSIDTHQVFERAKWTPLAEGSPLTLSEADVAELKSLNDRVSIKDVAEIYLPLLHLIDLQMAAAREAERFVVASFLKQPASRSPYIIAVAGSVAVGKSTIARLLQAMLSRLPGRPHVDLVATDGFLHPNRTLTELGLMQRKGFPESYDLRRMLAFLRTARMEDRTLSLPIYSHESYDIVPNQLQVVDRPDIIIFEGLNVLQTVSHAAAVASDFFDFSIYIDAAPEDIERWYVERFLLLQRTSFQKPTSYFHNFSDLAESEAVALAKRIWQEINLPNLVQNIQPTRARARVVIQKGSDHLVNTVWLRYHGLG